MAILICENCKESYQVYDYLADQRRFCSQKCFNDYRKKHTIKQPKSIFTMIAKYEKSAGTDDLGQWLYEKYVIEKQSYRDILKLLDTGNNRAIPRLLNHYGIPIRRGSEAVETQWQDNDLRRKQQAEAIKRIAKGNTINRLTISELKARYAEKDMELIERKIINNYTYVKYRCNKCGYVGWQMLGNFKRGCPQCNESKGELEVRRFLRRNHMKYRSQYKFKDCRNIHPLPFDFAVFKDNFLMGLIEYDGVQHFEPCKFFRGAEGFRERKRNDKIKDRYCRENRIPLVRIPYTTADVSDFLSKRIVNWK